MIARLGKYAVNSLVVCWLLTGCDAATGYRQEESTYRLFQGAWFEVQYPADFYPQPSMLSDTGEGYDSVSFQSPDGKVSFYVCSPQWARETSDIHLDPDTESMLSSEKRDTPEGQVETYTIVSNDGSYFRTYEATTRNEGAVHWVIGIKYVNQDAYQAFQPQFNYFRESLTQFAD